MLLVAVDIEVAAKRDVMIERRILQLSRTWGIREALRGRFETSRRRKVLPGSGFFAAQVFVGENSPRQNTYAALASSFVRPKLPGQNEQTQRYGQPFVGTGLSPHSREIQPARFPFQRKDAVF